MEEENNKSNMKLDVLLTDGSVLHLKSYNFNIMKIHKLTPSIGMDIF